MKVKCDLDDDLPLKKTLGLHSIILVVMPVFHKSDKCYPQVLDYHSIDVSKGIDTNKTDGWYEFINFYFWYFPKIIFRFQKKLRNDCHDMTQNPWVLMISNLLLSEEIIKGLT